MFYIHATQHIDIELINKLLEESEKNAIGGIFPTYGDNMKISIISTVSNKIVSFDKMSDAMMYIKNNRDIERMDVNSSNRNTLIMIVPNLNILRNYDLKDVEYLIHSVFDATSKINWNFILLHRFSNFEIIMPNKEIISGYDKIKNLVNSQMR
ncbi:MAG: hypothetical protein KDH96_11080 [Candidatus Riesia sp.]|nr:hypothetical protein [Candidatus Riesia sp.]